MLMIVAGISVATRGCCFGVGRYAYSWRKILENHSKGKSAGNHFCCAESRRQGVDSASLVKNVVGHHVLPQRSAAEQTCRIRR